MKPRNYGTPASRAIWRAILANKLKNHDAKVEKLTGWKEEYDAKVSPAAWVAHHLYLYRQNKNKINSLTSYTLQDITHHLPHQPHLSLVTLKPQLHLSLHSNLQLKPWRTVLSTNHRLSLIAHLSSSSTTTEVEEAAVEVVEEGPAEPRLQLIAQNVPWTCTCEDIRSLFEKHGTVLDVELSMYNKVRNRGLAFVTMGSEEEALAALKNLESYDMGGRVIKVEYARSVKKTPPPAAAPVEKYGVFVGNLAWRVRSRDLQELFDAEGNVVSAEVICQTEQPRRPPGYGFVFFSSKEAADAAVTTFNGKVLMGRPIRVVLKENQPGYTKEKSTEGEQVADALTKEKSTEGELVTDALSEVAAGDHIS